MKIKILSNDLEKLLKPVVKASSSNKTLQILNHIYFEAKGDKITIVGANPEYTVKITEKGDIVADGSFLVLGDKFLRIIKSLSDMEVIITSEDSSVSIKAGDSINFSLQTLPIEEYPKQILDVIETTYNFDVSQGDIKKAIKKLIKFCSSDASIQAIFTGFLFDLRESGDLTLVTTDTKRMGVYRSSYKAEEDTKNIKFVVPKQALEILYDSLLDEGPLNVGINFDDDGNVKNVVFKVPSITISSSVISGNFPNYEMVIPSVLNNYAIINRESLEEAIKRVSIISDKETNRVIFSFDRDNLKIEVQNNILGYAYEIVPCRYLGNPEIVHFNYEFILEYLSVLDAEEFYWGFNHYDSGNKMWSDEEKEFIYVCMPLRRT